LDAKAAGELRDLMRLVVTNGTATILKSVPGGPVYGKTGTAEYGTKNPPATHAWMVGWQGKVAFAVLVEDGKSGATVAAPIAKAFLENLQR
jgi:cell division protein FtsI/penicillin-binding protein 2